MSQPRPRVRTDLPKDMLGAIGRLIHGRVLHDIAPVHDGILIRCADGLEVEVAFVSTGAELKTFRLGVITADVCMPEELRYMRGKVLANALTRDDVFLLVAKDKHAIRFDWRTKQPEPRGVHAYVDVPPAAVFAEAGAVG